MPPPPIGDRAVTPAERQQRRRARLLGDAPSLRSRERGERVRALAAEYDLTRYTVYRTLEEAADWHRLDLDGREEIRNPWDHSPAVPPKRRPDETLAEYHTRFLAKFREFAADAHAEWQDRRRASAGISLPHGDVSRRANLALYYHLRVELHEAALAELGLDPEELTQLDARVQAELPSGA